METELSGKVALVTGGGSGIGLAVSTTLAAGGAKVIVTDHDAAAAERASEAIRAGGGHAVGVRADVTVGDDMRAAVETALRTFGSLDLAINNAGVPSPYAPLGEVERPDWDRIIGVNLTGVYLSLRHEIAAMLAGGGGAIVNVASIAAMNGIAGRGAYVAAKHGVVGLTKTAALEYAEHGIRVNAVAPGYVETPLLGDRDEAARARLAALHPMQRLASAQEIADTIVFMLSPRASFMTGHVCLVDGGYSAR